VIGRLLDWVYPPKCGLCSQFGPTAICDACAQDFKPLGLIPPSGSLVRVVAAFHYESRAAQAVRRLKYNRVTSLADPLAVLVRSAYDSFDCDEFDYIAPVPIHWMRRAYRGFNQSEALAAGLPADKVRPELLSRIRMTRPQVGLTREERVQNLLGAFAASTHAAGKSVLLVDDVTTSGHTAEQCAVALYGAGATRVGLLALTGES